MMRDNGTGWTPLLQGPEWDVIPEVLNELGEYLISVVEKRPPSDSMPIQQRERGTVWGGEGGIAVALNYLGIVTGNDRYVSGARLAIDQAEKVLDGLAGRPSLFSGFTGVAWAVKNVSSNAKAGVAVDADTFDEIDLALDEVLRRRGSRESYELIAGLSGYGGYLLSRSPSARSQALLERLIEYLEASCDRTPCGIAWRASDPFTVGEGPPDARLVRYHLGMAHGLAGVIAFLAAAYRRGISPVRTRALLSGAVQFLLDHRSEEPNKGFPRTVQLGQRSGQVDISWCWGDPGTASALLRAGLALNERTWIEVAANVLGAVIGRRPSPMLDHTEACLCHGTAGVAHIYNRFYQCTGDGAMAEAARIWWRITLNARKPGRGVAGYKFAVIDEEGSKVRHRVVPGLLTGVAGLAAALAAAISDCPPKWDSAMMLGDL